ncbi:hypothetical protein JJD41_03045, partial [Oxynema sp. CENA135]|uniref:hypothetical protein n=1 Tax=Oxynema sp. CENA135 TaxID=984206 RepID=UPI00190B5AD4
MIQRDRLEGGAIGSETPQNIEQTSFNTPRLDSPTPSGEYNPLIRQKETDSYPSYTQKNQLIPQESSESKFPLKTESFQKQNLENITFSPTSKAIQLITDSNIVQKQLSEVPPKSDLPRETTSTSQAETIQRETPEVVLNWDISEDTASVTEAETVQRQTDATVATSDISQETESVTEAVAVQRQSDDTVPSSDIAETT